MRTVTRSCDDVTLYPVSEWLYRLIGSYYSSTVYLLGVLSLFIVSHEIMVLNRHGDCYVHVWHIVVQLQHHSVMNDRWVIYICHKIFFMLYKTLKLYYEYFDLWCSREGGEGGWEGGREEERGGEGERGGNGVKRMESPLSYVMICGWVCHHGHLSLPSVQTVLCSAFIFTHVCRILPTFIQELLNALPTMWQPYDAQLSHRISNLIQDYPPWRAATTVRPICRLKR